MERKRECVRKKGRLPINYAGCFLISGDENKMCELPLLRFPYNEPV